MRLIFCLFYFLVVFHSIAVHHLAWVWLSKTLNMDNCLSALASWFSSYKINPHLNPFLIYFYFYKKLDFNLFLRFLFFYFQINFMVLPTWDWNFIPATAQRVQLKKFGWVNVGLTVRRPNWVELRTAIGTNRNSLTELSTCFSKTNDFKWLNIL